MEAQRAIETEPWPPGLQIRVRMGLHVGEVLDADDDLVGMSIHHAARIVSAAHGGQLILSEAVHDMSPALPADVTLAPLGTHRLRDVGSVRVFQVHHPDLQSEFPPLRGALVTRTNLPRIPTPFVGGERVVGCDRRATRARQPRHAHGHRWCRQDPGGVEFGHRHLAEFDQGVFFVDLAPVTNNGAVVGTLASTLPLVALGEQSCSTLSWTGSAIAGCCW